MSQRAFLALALGSLLLAAALIYGKSLQFGFTNWDDTKLIVDNPGIRSLSGDSLSTMFSLQKGRTFQPIRELSYALDYAMWGLRPGPYHAVNVLLHALGSCLLFLWFARVIPAFLPSWHRAQTRLAAWFGAMLFAVHPVHVEAVAWASSRKYGLLIVFTALAALVHWQAREREGASKYGLWAASLVAAVLAMLSSPVGVVVPTLIILTDLVLDRLAAVRKRWPAYLAYLLCNAFLTLALVGVLTEGEGKTARTHAHGDAINTVFTDLWVLVIYAKNLLAPLWLNCRYHHYVIDSLTPQACLGLALLVAAIAGAVILARKGNMLLAWAVAWFGIAWSPVANIIPISTIMADRYLYLPAVSLCVLAGIGGAALARRFSPAGVAIPALILLAYAAGAFQRCDVWRDSRALWTDSMAKDPNSALPYNNLALVLDDEGKLAKAEALYRKAVVYNPDYKEAYYNLGRALVQQNKLLDEAMTHIDRAIELDANFADAHNYRGILLRRKGEPEQAARAYEAALAIQPAHHEALTNLGNIHLLANRLQEAESYYLRALALAPGIAQLHANLGVIAHKTGDLELAISRYKQALAIQPNYETAQQNLLKLQEVLENPQ